MKIYFYVYTFLSILGIFSLTSLFFETLNYFDYVWLVLSIIITIISIIALYGYVFNKQLLTKKIWQLLLIVVIIAFIDDLFSVLFQGFSSGIIGYLSNYKLSQQVSSIFTFDSKVLGLLLQIPIVYALFKLFTSKAEKRKR